MHDALLRDTSGLTDSIVGQVGSSELLPWAVGEEVSAVISFLNQGSQEGYSEGWDPAMGEEAAIVENGERNGRVGQGFGGGRESCEGRVGNVMP